MYRNSTCSIDCSSEHTPSFGYSNDASIGCKTLFKATTVCSITGKLAVSSNVIDITSAPTSACTSMMLLIHRVVWVTGPKPSNNC